MKTRVMTEYPTLKQARQEFESAFPIQFGTGKSEQNSAWARYRRSAEAWIRPYLHLIESLWSTEDLINQIRGNNRFWSILLLYAIGESYALGESRLGSRLSHFSSLSPGILNQDVHAELLRTRKKVKSHHDSLTKARLDFKKLFTSKLGSGHADQNSAWSWYRESAKAWIRPYLHLIGSEWSVENLVYEIRHGGDRFWSIVLVYAIGESRGGSLMADDLLSLYGNTGPDTEPEIVKALEKIAGKEQIPLLLAKGWNCLTVLAHLGPDAVPDLLSFLREETCSNLINRIKPEYPIDDDKILTLACTRTRCAILTALGAIGDPSAVDDIILWISVEDTAPAALTALGGLKDERVIPLLYNVVKESKDDNRRSLALGSLVSQAKDLDQLEIPQDLVGKLIDILNATHEQSRMHAAQVLGYSDDLTAIPSLIRTLANEYRYSGTKTAFEAAHSLGRIYKFWPEFASGPREAAAIRHYLREEAKNEESSGIVQRALLAAEERSKTLKQQTSLRCTTCDSEKLTKRKVRVGLFKSYRFVVCSNCGVSRNLKNND